MEEKETEPEPEPLEDQVRACDCCGAADAILSDEIWHPNPDHAVSDGVVCVHERVPLFLCESCRSIWNTHKVVAFWNFFGSQRAVLQQGAEQAYAYFLEGKEDGDGEAEPPEVQ